MAVDIVLKYRDRLLLLPSSSSRYPKEPIDPLTFTTQKDLSATMSPKPKPLQTERRPANAWKCSGCGTVNLQQSDKCPMPDCDGRRKGTGSAPYYLKQDSVSRKQDKILPKGH